MEISYLGPISFEIPRTQKIGLNNVCMVDYVCCRRHRCVDPRLAQNQLNRFYSNFH